MATSALIPVSEYLNSTYHPDCDYVDGEVLERNLGTTPHSTVQGLLLRIFGNHRMLWGVRVFVEQRLKVSATRFRIPDVCVVTTGGEPLGPIIQRTPLICIEVLSPEDSRRTIQPRIDDYLLMGVGNIRVIDPVRRLAWVVNADGWQPLEGAIFSVAQTPIRIELAEIYSELDELAAGR